VCTCAQALAGHHFREEAFYAGAGVERGGLGEGLVRGEGFGMVVRGSGSG